MRTLLLGLALLADASPPPEPFNPRALEQVHALAPKGGEIYALALSPESGRLLVGCDDGTARVYDTKTWREIHRLDAHAGGGCGVYGVAISPDGKTLATAGARDGTIKLWDAATGAAERTLAGKAGIYYRLAFNPGGQTLLAGAHGAEAEVWDVAGGVRTRALAGHASFVYAVGFSPDGRRAATSDGAGTLRFWKTESWELEKSLKAHGGAIYALDFSRDSRRILTGGSRGQAKIWNVETGHLEATLDGFRQDVRGAAFTRDGRYAVCSDGSSVRIFDLRRAREAVTLPLANGETLFELKTDANGRNFAAVGGRGQIFVWGPREK